MLRRGCFALIVLSLLVTPVEAKKKKAAAPNPPTGGQEMLLTPWPPEVRTVNALLDSSGLTPELKAQAHAAYFSTNRAGRFQQVFMNIPISPTLKNALWVLKFPTPAQVYVPAASQPDYNARNVRLLTERQSASTFYYAPPVESPRTIVIAPSLLEDMPLHHYAPSPYTDPMLGLPGYQPLQRQVYCSTWTDGKNGSISCY